MKSSIVCFIILLASTTALLLSRNVSEKKAENREARIAGGYQTTIQDHPHQVSVRRYQVHKCGGSIISTARVLTSAWCIDPIESPRIYSILAGTADRTDKYNGQLSEISKFTRHPDYKGDTLENDIAILELETPLVFGSTVRAIVLPPHNAPDIPDGALVTVTGWGYHYNGSGHPINLRAVSMPIIWNWRCSVIRGGDITLKMLCAGILNGGLDFCPGDDGGPLVFQGVLHGISSLGYGCGYGKRPGMYTRVSSFTTWIQNFIV